MDEKYIKDKYTYDDLLKIIKYLRSEQGCTWDREQTHKSLRICLIEEAYEVVQAINKNDDNNLREELGDVLLQIVFHSDIAESEKRFSMAEVIDGICKKMIRRHPHVFGNEEADTSQKVEQQWDEIKKGEKDFKTVTDELKSVPEAFPALIRAAKVQKKAAKVGFDFEDIDEVIEKVEEELIELKAAKDTSNLADIEEEFGDLLFTMVNLSRFFKINAENSLTNAIEKFITRFEGVELLVNEEGKELS